MVSWSFVILSPFSWIPEGFQMDFRFSINPIGDKMTDAVIHGLLLEFALALGPQSTSDRSEAKGAGEGRG